MRLAVSDIAWAPQDEAAAYALLRARGITGLEIAPGLFFHGAGDVFEPTAAEAEAALSRMRAAGLELVSMQSLLFGVSGAELFGDRAARAQFRAAMLRAIALAGRFSIPNLVFGSPRQRVVPEGMTAAGALGIARDVFRDLGDAAGQAGTALGIEFNPKAYGTNFLNTADAALDFVEAVDHPAVTLILDMGAMHMNGDFGALARIVGRAAGRISHVHFSEPDLIPAPADPGQAAEVLGVMTRAGYQGWFSIEMKPGAVKPDAGPGLAGLADLAASLDRLQAAVALAEAAGAAKARSAKAPAR